MDSPDRPASSCTVLLVDDVPANLTALEAVLEPLGARLVRAASGADALKVLLREDVSLILLDVQMPGLDGFETARLIRGRERTRHVPIVFVTAIGREEQHILRGYAEGAIDYLVKPFSPEVLRAKVAAQLEACGREAQVRHDAEAARAQARESEALRVRAEAELLARVRAERNRLRTLLAQAPFPITLLRGEALVVELSNDAARALVGGRDVVGRPAREAVAELAPQGYFELVQRVFRSGEPFVGRELSVTFDRGTDGRAVEGRFNFVLQPTHDEEGRVDGVLVCGFEVTQEVRAREAAEASARMRDEFLAVASHELKTPLTPLLLRLQALLEPGEEDGEALPPAVRSSLERARAQTKRLLELVDRLLDVSRLSAGRLQLHPEDGVDLARLLRELVERLADVALRAGCTLTLDAPAPALGRFDPVRVDQVFSNLVSNALKFGAGRPVRLVLRTEDALARVAVHDEGRGIAQEDLGRIFQKFERVADGGRHGGLGLGLYIVRELVEAMGGRIGVTSTPGRGTTFAVELPREQGPVEG